MSSTTEQVQKKEAAPAARGEVAQAGGGAAAASIKAGLRGMSYDAQCEALQFKHSPVQRDEAPAAEHAEDGHDHGSEPAPGGEAAAAAPVRKSGDDVPADVRTKLIDKLKGIPRSKETLDAIEKAGKMDFPLKWSDAGTFHIAGAIHLRSTSTEDSWIASMSHELVHLQTFVEGKAADATKQGKEEFVKAKMDDEIKAHAATYLTLLQSGGSAGAAGFADFKTFVEKDHKAALDAKKWSELDAIARTWLADKYKNVFTTNNTKENYYVYWGNHWDKANRK